MRPLEITLGRDRLRAEQIRDGSVTWQAEASFGSPEELAQLIATLRTQEGFDPSIRRVHVTLQPSLVQQRTLFDMPPVPLRALKKLVALQQGRFFRRNGKPLVTNARWQPAARGAPRAVEAVAVEAPWLDAVGEGVHNAGLALDQVQISDSALTLLPSDEIARRRRYALRQIRWLAGGAFCCWTAALLVHLGRLVTADRRLSLELTALEQPALAVRQARQQLAVAASVIDSAEQMAARRASASVLLARVVEALPDSAYLSSITIDSVGSGILTGSASHPAAYVARLERGELAARFDGEPMPEGAAGGWARFTLRLGSDARP